MYRGDAYVDVDVVVVGDKSLVVRSGLEIIYRSEVITMMMNLERYKNGAL